MGTKKVRRSGRPKPEKALSFHHCIDLCTQHELAGWSTAPSLAVTVNGCIAGSAVPSIQRDDLVAAGIEAGRGFRFLFDQPVWLDDEIAVVGPDGSQCRGRLADSFDKRIRELTRYLDLEAQVGFEIGPLDRPLLPKSRFQVYYMDQASRADLEARYGNQCVNLSALVEPDFVVGTSSFAEIVGSQRFDYCVASHVIEHIPDMIGWLWEIWSVLKDDGVLSLAVPHGEKTFDAKRRLTTNRSPLARGRGSKRLGKDSGAQHRRRPSHGGADRNTTVIQAGQRVTDVAPRGGADRNEVAGRCAP